MRFVKARLSLRANLGKHHGTDAGQLVSHGVVTVVWTTPHNVIEVWAGAETPPTPRSFTLHPPLVVHLPPPVSHCDTIGKFKITLLLLRLRSFSGKQRRLLEIVLHRRRSLGSRRLSLMAGGRTPPPTIPSSPQHRFSVPDPLAPAPRSRQKDFAVASAPTFSRRRLSTF